MNRIKSALEIAMERMKEQQKDGGDKAAFNEEEEYIKAATVLGRTFLQGKTSKEEIREKLERYPEQSRAAALRAFIGELAVKMDLGNTPLVLETMQYLKKDEQTRQNCAAVEEFYHQYRHRLAESLSRLEETSAQWQRKKLARAGIRGSAIAGFNIKGLATWQETRQQIEEEYAKVLESFRRVIAG
ncbi:MAG: hypothetical protein AB1796_01830 [Bacillota bacterium]